MGTIWSTSYSSFSPFMVCFIVLGVIACLVTDRMAPHSNTLTWKIPWTEEPSRLQSMGSWRVGLDWATSLSLLCLGEGNGNPLQCSCLENPKDGGAWWAAVYGVAQSRTRLKWLSSRIIPPFWEFPGGPMVRTCAFTDKGLRLIPGQGTKIPQVARLAKIINK